MKFKAMTCLLTRCLIVLMVSVPVSAAPKERDPRTDQKGHQAQQQSQWPPQQQSQQKSQYQSQQQSQQRSDQSSMSAQQAVSIAQQRQQGKVLSVKRNNGYYQIKMLHEGKVRYVKVSTD